MIPCSHLFYMTAAISILMAILTINEFFNGYAEVFISLIMAAAGWFAATIAWYYAATLEKKHARH